MWKALKTRLRECEAYHDALEKNPKHVPENPHKNYSLRKDDPIPTTPYNRRVALHELLTMEGWWQKMRAQTMPERETLEIRNKMLARWAITSQDPTKRSGGAGLGQSAARAESPTDGGKKRKSAASSSTDAGPRVKRSDSQNP